MPTDGGVFIDARNNGNMTIPWIQCRGRNNHWRLGELVVECSNMDEIILLWDTKRRNLIVGILFRQMATRFNFTVEGILLTVYVIFITILINYSDTTCQTGIDVSHQITSAGFDVLINIHPPTCDGWRKKNHYVYALEPVDKNSGVERISRPVQSLSHTFKDVPPGTFDILVQIKNHCDQLSTLDRLRYPVSGIYIMNQCNRHK